MGAARLPCGYCHAPWEAPRWCPECAPTKPPVEVGPVKCLNCDGGGKALDMDGEPTHTKCPMCGGSGIEDLPKPPTSDGLEARALAFRHAAFAGRMIDEVDSNRVAADFAREELDSLRWKLTDRAIDSDEGKHIPLEEFHDVWIAHLKGEP